MAKILIIEDEEAISNLIRMSLTNAGYECVCALDGLAGADLLEVQEFDLVLLDIMLPKVDGYELMEYIASLGTPAIFLTARASVADRVRGLKMGAEDYLPKPFEIVELLARVETVLRRFHKAEDRLAYGDLEVDVRSLVVKKQGVPVKLTKKEFELFVLFLRNKNITLFRDLIYEKVWEKEFNGDTRTVDLHVQRLRRKLGLEKKIVAVYKVGYRLEA